MLYVRQLSDARPAGRVRCWQAQCREPNTGLLKVQLASKTEHFAHLGILFIYDCSHSAWRIRIIWYRSGSWIWKKNITDPDPDQTLIRTRIQSKTLRIRHSQCTMWTFWAEFYLETPSVAARDPSRSELSLDIEFFLSGSDH